MASKTPESSGGVSRLRTLVVEDEFPVDLDLPAVLEGNGYSLLGPTGTVDAALYLLAHEQPDLAVLTEAGKAGKTFIGRQPLAALGRVRATG